MRLLISAFICLLASTAFCQNSTEFSRPWRNETAAIVIDPYEGNSIDWSKLSTDVRVVGVIHRASDGGRADKKYAVRKTEALTRGYLWGSYHVGRPGDPIQQADQYLAITDPGPDELIALDIEQLNGKFMTLENAEIFIRRIYEILQRYPVLYVNHATALEISHRINKDSVFSKLPLWYARFKPAINDFPNKIWPTYWLWQFSSEINCKAIGACLYNVPGVNYDMDVNVFNGSIEDIRARWPLTFMVSDPSGAHQDN